MLPRICRRFFAQRISQGLYLCKKTEERAPKRKQEKHPDRNRERDDKRRYVSSTQEEMSLHPEPLRLLSNLLLSQDHQTISAILSKPERSFKQMWPYFKKTI